MLFGCLQVQEMTKCSEILDPTEHPSHKFDNLSLVFLNKYLLDYYLYPTFLLSDLNCAQNTDEI